MRIYYNNTLEMMYQCNEELANLISKFVKSFPDALTKKIDDRKNKGIVTKDGKRWEFEDNGKEFSISVGKDTNSSKDYMSLFLSTVTDNNLEHWARFEGERLIGYVTLYLYDEKNPRAKALPVMYDFYAKRIDDKIFVEISTNVSSANRDNAARLEQYGILDMHRNIIEGHYEIDAKSILAKRNKLK